MKAIIPGFLKDNSRSALVKKNIAGSLVVKGWSAVVQFLIVPLSLDCLTKYEYGIWLTINSILIGIDAIDAGLGNGLRNKLAEAMAKNDKIDARRQVSTTFFMLIAIITPIILLLSLFILCTDSYRLLNVSPLLVPNLNGILIITFAIMGATFIFKFIGNMFFGLQLPAINNMLVVLGQTVSLAGIFILYLLDMGTLMTVAVVFTLSPLVVYLVAYPITFSNKYKFLTPSIKFCNKKTFKPLFSLGIRFFIIQITGLMLFMSSNLIISYTLSPAEVTPYQIAYRYYTILFMIFTIIASPLWAATTDAYTKGDWPWINNVMRKMNYLLIACIGIIIFMYFFSPIFYYLWGISNKVTISNRLSILMAIYSYFLVFSNCYSNIIFGIGKIKLIMTTSLVEIILFIPLQFYACKNYGVEGLLSVIIVATLIMATLNHIQFKKLSTNKAQGIWNQ